MNYNASFTWENIFGFNNLNTEINIYKDEHFISSLFIRDCLLSLFKLYANRNSSGGRWQCHPACMFTNIQEAEALISGFAKHAGGFSLHLFLEVGVDESYISKNQHKFIDPPLVHSADQYKWPPNSKAIFNLEEQQKVQSTAKLKKLLVNWYQQKNGRNIHGKKEKMEANMNPLTNTWLGC